MLDKFLFVINDQHIVKPEKEHPSQSVIQTKPYWENPEIGCSLYLGDALEILKEIPDNSVDCIWTDPPYNLSNDGITCVGGKMVPVNKGEWDRSRGIEGDFEFNLTWTRECYRILRYTGTIWVTGTLHVHPSVGMALMKNNFRLLNDIVWEKANPPPNLGRRMFTHSSELIYWASKAAKGSKHKHKFNYEDMKSENGGKQMKSVWKFNAARPQEKTHGKHPTQKPVDLISRCLRASTDAGDLVLDPFFGSGSTGIAALELGRKFIGIERELEFLSIAVDRICEFSPPPPHIWSFERVTTIIRRSSGSSREFVLRWSNASRRSHSTSSRSRRSRLTATRRKAWSHRFLVR